MINRRVSEIKNIFSKPNILYYCESDMAEYYGWHFPHRRVIPDGSYPARPAQYLSKTKYIDCSRPCCEEHYERPDERKIINDELTSYGLECI